MNTENKTAPNSLILNNRTIAYENIISGAFDTSSAFEENTLRFCQQWLIGKELFQQKTSGSTGLPKVINLQRRLMKLSAKNTIEALHLEKNDAALVCLDTAYIAGKMMIVRALEHNLKMTIVEPSPNPTELVYNHIDFAAMVPLQLQNTINSPTAIKKIRNCKAIIVGGAPVNSHLALHISKLQTPVYSTFGMTETVSHIALKKLSVPSEKHYTTIGDTKIRTNQNDELIIKGSITENKELITRDRIKLLSPTSFVWLGRSDNIINSGGVKIQMEAVEHSIGLLLDKIGINNRFFLGTMSDQTFGQKLVLYMEGSKANLPEDLLQLLKADLNKFEDPKELVMMSEFVETSTGKIDKNSTIKHRQDKGL